jgi:hypothetical protein
VRFRPSVGSGALLVALIVVGAAAADVQPISPGFPELTDPNPVAPNIEVRTRAHRLRQLRDRIEAGAPELLGEYRSLYDGSAERGRNLLEVVRLMGEGSAAGVDALAPFAFGHLYYHHARMEALSAAGDEREATEEAARVEVILELILSQGDGSRLRPYVVLDLHEPLALIALGGFGVRGGMLHFREADAVLLMTVAEDGGQTRELSFLIPRIVPALRRMDPPASVLAFYETMWETGYRPAVNAIALASWLELPATNIDPEIVRRMQAFAAEDDVYAIEWLGHHFAELAELDSGPRARRFRAQATDAWIRAIELGSTGAAGALARHYYMGHVPGMDDDTVMALLSAGVHAGAPQSMFTMGLVLSGQLGRAEVDLDAAAELFMATGSMDGVVEYSRIRLPLDGSAHLDPDSVERLRWAAGHGHPVAALHLGQLYLRGCYVERDRERAREVLARSVAAKSMPQAAVDAAWILATYPDDDVRDGFGAVWIMRRVIDISTAALMRVDWRRVYAIALAEDGLVRDAVRELEDLVHVARGDAALQAQLQADIARIEAGDLIRIDASPRCEPQLARVRS